MNTAAARIDAILDDPLAPARAQGGTGYVGLDFPQDVAFALPTPCLHLPWRATGATPFADRWLESSFPGVSRSILERWSAGEFDALGAVVFSRGDDASQRLYYYVRELQRRGRLGGPEALILDVAKIPRDTSRRHTRAALRAVLEGLGVDSAALRRGISRANALRAAFARLSTTLAHDGEFRHRLARASLFADVSSATSNAAPSNAAPPGTAHGRRVLLVGSAPPDERLHQAVARAGGVIVAETHGYGLRRLGPAIDAASQDCIASVADRLHESSGPRRFADPSRDLEAALSASSAGAVILWITREDEALAWHVPALRRLVQEQRIPLLELTARRWDAQDGALDAIEDFMGRTS